MQLMEAVRIILMRQGHDHFGFPDSRPISGITSLMTWGKNCVLLLPVTQETACLTVTELTAYRMPSVNATLDRGKGSRAESQFWRPRLKYLTVSDVCKSCYNCSVRDSNSVLQIYFP